MSDTTTVLLRKTIDDLYRRESRRVLARLIRLLSDLILPKKRCMKPFVPPSSYGRAKDCPPPLR